MSDTEKSIIDTSYTSAKTFNTHVTIATDTTSQCVTTAPTSRIDGKVKLRIAPREMPERVITTSTV